MLLQRKCACGGNASGGGECEECKKKEGTTLQRFSNGRGGAGAVPPIVHEVLRSPGQPLDPAMRAFMEPRFGHDFSKVRVHTGARAAESAQAVSAVAYTVGQNLVFGAKSYALQSAAGRRVLAHELTHVVQQQGSGARSDAPLRIAPEHDEAEREAERASEGVSSGERVEPRFGQPAPRLQRLMCDSILNAEEATRVSGNEAERQIRTDFILQVGPKATRFPIPGSSATAFRTECGGSESSIEPQITGGAAGLGTPDLMFIDGKRAELAEVKIGTWPCLDFAEKQAKNYVDKGNSIENNQWRTSHGIDSFALMQTGRFTPANFEIAGQNVSAGWCEPGVIVYKPIAKKDEETFVCGSISDKGAVDRFLDKVMDPAQAAVDRFLDQTVSPIIDKAIEDKLKEQNLEFGMVIVRRLISSLKTRILDMLRKQMKAQLRQYLQNSLNTLCAAAAAKAVISVKDLLDKLDKEMGPMVLAPALVPVAQQLAGEIAQEILEIAKEVGQAIADAVGKVLEVVLTVVLAILAARFFRVPVQAPTGIPGPFLTPGPQASLEGTPKPDGGLAGASALPSSPAQGASSPQQEVV